MKNKRLERLFRLARQASAAITPAEISAPVGFSTRVATRWAGDRPALTGLWERVCWWGAAASVMVCLSANVYQASLREPAAFDEFVDLPMIETEIF